MGIKDLLRFMKPYIEPIHIKKYAGKRVGIDAYSWLHKGAYSCSMELHLDSDGTKKLKYIDYFMHRIHLLRYYRLTPVVVFDGGNIPCKAATEQERHRRRKANRDFALARLKDGDVKGASGLFQRAITVTPSMAYQLIQILKSENIEFIVAPYEADAQLAYLASLETDRGGIVAVITEDSDLLAYGCGATIFKMDRHGNGEELAMDNVFNSVACKPSFQNFDKVLFTGMCVLAGCDFLPSVPGIGIVKAHTFVSKYRDLDRVLSVLKLEKGGQMPEEYSKSFREAVAVFQHARVYDPKTKTLKHMKPVPQELHQSLDGELDFLGPELPPSMASAIAEGKLDPITMEAFDISASSQKCPDQVQISRSFHKPRTALLPEQAAFVVTRESKELQVISGTFTSTPTSTKRKHFKEDTALHKLIEETHPPAESTHSSGHAVLKFPDNNQFKRRKTGEISTKNVQEKATETLSVGDAPIRPSPKNGAADTENHQGSVVYLSQVDNSSEQVSFVAKTMDVSEFSCLVTRPHETSHPRPQRTSGPQARSKREKLKNGCKAPENKKISSILNFFARV